VPAGKSEKGKKWQNILEKLKPDDFGKYKTQRSALPIAACTIRPYPIVSQDNPLPGYRLCCLSIDTQAPLSYNNLNQKEVSITRPPTVARKEQGLLRSPSTAN